LTAQGTSYTDTGASAGTTYYYRVLSSDGADTSDPSDPASNAVLPAAPTALTVTPTDSTHVQLAWTANGLQSQRTGFTIEQSTDGFNFTQVATAAASSSSYTATLPASPGALTYRVNATNAAGHSASAYADFAPTPTDINFDDLAVGTAVTTHYPQATFSADSGNTPTVEPNDGLGTSGNTIGVEPPSPYPQNYNKPLYVDFSGPVYGLSFETLADDDSGTIAQVRVFVNGAYSSTVAITGDANPYGPQLVDLTAFQNVTRIEITNITDAAGLWYDDFKFHTSPPISLTAYRTGNNLGVPVSSSIQHGGDPTQYLMLVSDQEDPLTGSPFDTESSVPVQNDQPVLGPDGKPPGPRPGQDHAAPTPSGNYQRHGDDFLLRPVRRAIV
jgi:hypothetical protein